MTVLLAGRPPIWYCEPNYLRCRSGQHAQVFHRTGFHVDHRRIDGHLLLCCDGCSGDRYAFAVVHSKPSPIVHCYAITKEQYAWLKDTPDEKMDPPLEVERETEDLLFRLGYHPTYERRTV